MENNNNPYGVKEGESKGHKMLGILLLSIFIIGLFTISWLYYDNLLWLLSYIKHFILIVLFLILSHSIL